MRHIDMDKKALREKEERMRMLKQQRARSRDEKYAGHAGPPDVQEPAAVQAVVQTEARVVCKRGSDASAADWDMVGADEHLHSPPSSRPPCTSRTPARCTVS